MGRKRQTRKSTTISAKEVRSFQWLSKKLDQAIKKMGLLPPRRQRDIDMFGGPKERYD